MSEYLSPGALRGLLKVGEHLVPGGGGLPSFAAAERLAHADVMLRELPEGDRRALLQLLVTLGRLPRWTLACLLWTCHRADRFPGPVATVLRQVDLGLRGLVFGVYYSHDPIRRTLGWNAAIRRPAPNQETP